MTMPDWYPTDDELDADQKRRDLMPDDPSARCGLCGGIHHQFDCTRGNMPETRDEE